MTAVTSAVLFRSESKGSDFHASERMSNIDFLTADIPMIQQQKFDQSE